ncbi:MAG: hypothetical protein KDB14_03255 [Planctomycetales bacterium]|nr:hypothetical protein [Planctomycetales bacterium]
MNAALRGVASWWGHCEDQWHRFWFTPAEPHTLALMRLLAGGMLFYTHLVWALDLRAFFGPDAWLPTETGAAWSRFSWTPMWHIRSMPLLWMVHLAGMAVIGMAAVGWHTRVTSKLAWLVALAYVHRQHGALFGLDQVNVMMAMYLAIGAGGDAYSVDRWLARRRGEPAPPPRVSTNIAVRLLQLQLCVIYLFGGIGKAQGPSWWQGTAVWMAAASYEYQSLDMTWLVHYPMLVATLCHITTLWEAFYCALVWPLATRPIALLLAVAVHGGIAMYLGMITFGIAMIIANMAFLPAPLVRTWLGGAAEKPA